MEAKKPLTGDPVAAAAFVVAGLSPPAAAVAAGRAAVPALAEPKRGPDAAGAGEDDPPGLAPGAEPVPPTAGRLPKPPDDGELLEVDDPGEAGLSAA